MDQTGQDKENLGKWMVKTVNVYGFIDDEIIKHIKLKTGKGNGE